MHKFTALLSGALFGVGLYVSGMTNTEKVKGFLDLFGAWDPTLAFVMGGAVSVMAVAWRIAARRSEPILGGTLPGRPGPEFDPPFIVGSVLFGVGWGLAGLCPGPAIASVTWGGVGGLIFLTSMLAGMAAAPPIRGVFRPA